MFQAIMRSDAVYQYPIWAVGLSMAAGSIAASLLLQIVVGRFFHLEHRRRHNDVTAAIMSIVGVTYAVLLAFVAMLAWEDYRAAKAATSHEAVVLFDVAKTAAGLADPARSEFLANLASYARTVQDVEWPAQAAGRISRAGGPFLDRADALVAALRPTDIGQGNIQSGLIASLTQLRDARGARLEAVATSIPDVVWFVVIAGGALTLAITALLGARSIRLHVVLTALVALSGTLVLVMIVALSHPFRGDFRVTPEPFALMLQRMDGR